MGVTIANLLGESSFPAREKIKCVGNCLLIMFPQTSETVAFSWLLLNQEIRGKSGEKKSFQNVKEFKEILSIALFYFRVPTFHTLSHI